MEGRVPSGTGRVEMVALDGIPEIGPGADLGAIIAQAATAMGILLRDDDIVVVAQKIVSKAEGRFRPVDGIVASPRAEELAAICGKDARKVQAVLDESTEILRVAGNGRNGVLIARHRQGWVMANAGTDESNLGQEGQLLLLPENADDSAAGIATGIAALRQARPGIIITDTFGRPWRHGLLNVAIGLSDVPALIDWADATDAYGRRLEVTVQGFADEIAAAAGLLMPKDAQTPVVLMRGLGWTRKPGSRATDHIRPLREDLFK